MNDFQQVIAAIEGVDGFQYLGLYVGSVDREIAERCTAASLGAMAV